MPLTRGHAVGYDASLMMFKFTMMTPDARIVECAISSAAMDCVVGSRRIRAVDREAQFLKLRDQIEHIAATIFDNEESSVVHVFAKQVERGKRRRRKLRSDGG